jgi:hypothetical protein
VSTAVAIFAILGSAVTVLGGQAGLLWWAFRRGEEAGERKAGQAEDRTKIEALEQQLAATRAELAAILQNPRHTLRVACVITRRRRGNRPSFRWCPSP